MALHVRKHASSRAALLILMPWLEGLRPRVPRLQDCPAPWYFRWLRPWDGIPADASTAFLQGREQDRKLWVKLPAEALALLGGDENTRIATVRLMHPVAGSLKLLIA